MPAPHPRMHGLTHVPGGPDPIPVATAAPTGGGGCNCLAEGFGFLAWTIDPAYATNTFRPTTRTVLAPVCLSAGTVVTSIGTVYPSVEVTPPTHAYYAIYTPAYALGGVTADTPSVCNLAGWHVVALTSPYTVPADGLYYIGGLYNAASQTPTHLAGLTNYSGFPAFPAGGYRAPQQASLTTFPNPFVPTSTAANVPLFVAI